MIGIVVIIAISWVLLYVIEKKNILVLGFTPIAQRLIQFLIGFFYTATLCAVYQCFEAYLKSSIWSLNENITTGIVLKSFWWNVKSVLTEELIFRGALLYILIRKLGSRKSIAISAIAFGFYHWFSYGVWGNVMAMIYVFIGTGLMGYAWSWAFSKTKSIMLPFGLHLGWNFIYNTIFSKGPFGELVLISVGGTEFADWSSTLYFLTGLLIVPLFVIIYVGFFVQNKKYEES